MIISFDNALGIHPRSLELRAERNQVLATNLANADTPGFKARDVAFESVLQASLPAPIRLAASQPGHLTPEHELSEGRTMYRVPTQPSLDGNTVETHIEQAKFMENALQYQASLAFINGKLAGLMTALRGE